MSHLSEEAAGYDPRRAAGTPNLNRAALEGCGLSRQKRIFIAGTEFPVIDHDALKRELVEGQGELVIASRCSHHGRSLFG